MRVKNNRMIKAREEMGFDTVASFCRAVGKGASQSEVGAYENFRKSPIKVAKELVVICIAPDCEALLSAKQITCEGHRPIQDELLADPYISDLLPYSWRPSAIRIAGHLFREPEWLWPDEVRHVKDAVMLSVELEASEAKMLSEAAEGDLSLRRLKGIVSEALDGLSDREREIIRKRFGLEGESEHTCGEIANQQGISAGRINQLEMKALRGLRHPHISNKLKDFID
jgi:DNA-binding CsgD family transcriptional regulator